MLGLSTSEIKSYIMHSNTSILYFPYIADLLSVHGVPMKIKEKQFLQREGKEERGKGREWGWGSEEEETEEKRKEEKEGG